MSGAHHDGDFVFAGTVDSERHRYSIDVNTKLDGGWDFGVAMHDLDK